MKDIDGWILANIVNEKLKFPVRRFFCAATAVAVAGVVSAGTAAYSAYSQSKAQKDAASQAQAGLAGNKEGAYGRKVELPDYNDRIGTEDRYDPFGDFEASLPSIFNVASQINARGMRMRDRVSGGTFRSNLAKQGSNIESLLNGEIPDDVADVINRTVAERLGGAFDPSVPGGFAGGISRTGSALARSLGQTSLDIMGKGMTYAPEWERLVDSFTYTPGKAIADAGTFISAAQLQLARDRTNYEAEVAQEQAAAGADPQVSGFMNDSLRLGAVGQQADANQMRALSGLVTAGVGGINSIYGATRPPAINTPYPNAGTSRMPGGGYAVIPNRVS